MKKLFDLKKKVQLITDTIISQDGQQIIFQLRRLMWIEINSFDIEKEAQAIVLNTERAQTSY